MLRMPVRLAPLHVSVDGSLQRVSQSSFAASNLLFLSTHGILDVLMMHVLLIARYIRVDMPANTAASV